MSKPDEDILDRAAAAALALAADRPWPHISLRDIAAKAEISLADLYALADSKGRIVDHLARRFDRAALATAAHEGDADLHDRLFDAAMARIEAMEPHPYDEDGRYFRVNDAGGRSGLIFETSHGRVTSFRAGREPALSYIEGCS